MRVVQLLTTVSFGDAVSNDAIAIHDILVRNGYHTGLYAENIDVRLPKGLVAEYTDMPTLEKDDVLLYHLSTGTQLNYLVQKIACRKIMIYHNITPPGFFELYSSVSRDLCGKGLEETKMLKDTFDYVLADSEFNKQDLINMGYKCPIDVLPILIEFGDYAQKPNKLTLKKYDDGVTNIIFVGRVAPNKKHEDVINAFYHYQKFYNPKSRLFLIGSTGGMECYVQRLKDYIQQLGVSNVIFPGHIKFDEILAFYKLADVFLCMSEHEGFCVPLVEAMYFDVPVIAYDSCAIAETMGGSGAVLKQKDPLEVAGLINYVVQNDAIREQMISGQKKRLKDFDNEVIAKQFWDYLNHFLEK